MAIQVGSVEVDVIPNTRGIYNRLRDGLVPAATRAGEDAGSAAGRAFGPAMQRQVGDIGLRIGEQIGQQIASRITAALRDAVRDGVTRGGQAARPAAARRGEETGGAFARSMKARLEAAFKSLPKANVSLDETGVDADLARLRARMETLSGKRIGIDVDVAAAQAEITDIEERLLRLGAAHPNVSVRADTAAARAQLAAMREEINRLTADPHRIRLETDGSFGTRLRAAVQAAEASLQNINIGVDTTAADAELASLRAQLTALRDQRIGIDIDAATATAKIADIQARLERLSASDADVNVRVDSAAAAAQLAQVQAMVSALDGKRARIDIDAGGAQGAIFQLAVAVASVGALPAIPALVAGLGAVASAGVAAAVGVGAIAAVAVPAFTGIAGALMAQKQAQDAATNATYRGGQAASQGASRALQMAGAQQALASAHRNATRQIAQAEQGVQDAVRSAAEANRNAAQQVQQARQALADAYQQAADRMRSANEQVQQAERSLADAQDAARQAQQDLTQARKDAAQQLEDLNNRLADSQLSERDAVLSVQEARKRLDAVQAAGANASLLQQQRAQLAYDQAVQRLKEQRLETARTAAEKAAADKAGVEGSDTVRTAQERLAQAQQAVKDQQAALAKAQQAAARQQIQNTRDIASAQEKLAEAQRNVTRVQEDGARSVARAQESLAAAQQSAADSIASAQRQIESASLSAAGGVDQAAIAQQKYQEKLAKLTPAARDTFDAFVDLRGAFSKWSKSLQPDVMPIFTRALVGLKNSLPGLTPLVKGAAAGVKELQDRASAGFKKPWWQGFKKDLAKNITPAIVGLGVAFGNVFKGMVGVINAFLPHMDGISSRMQTITGRFANWGTSLKGSPEFEQFLDYAAEKGPQVAEALGKVFGAFFQVSKALSPISGPLLKAIGGIADAIGSLAEDAPWAIQGLFGLWMAMRLVNAVFSASPIGLVVLGLFGLVLAIKYAWDHFETFRDIVKGVWSAITVVFSTAWTVVQAVFTAFWGAIQWVGDKAVWLWQNILKPVFSAIALAAGILITAVLTILITPLVLAFQLVATVAMWLWTNAISPTFNAIAAAAGWLWRNAIGPAFRGIASVARWLYDTAIKPVGALIVGSFRTVGDWGKWLWQRALAPAFRGIADVARWLRDKVIKPVFEGISGTIGRVWRTGIRPIFNAIKDAIGKVADAFEDAKDAIAKAWDKIKDATKSPINWVLRVVWNNGIVKIWKKISGWIPGVPQLGKVDYLAAGGQLRGPQPGMYNAPTAIVGEGNPRYPEYVIPTDPRYRTRALALHQAAGTQMLAKGGVIGSAKSFLKNPLKVFDAMVKPFMDGAKWLGETTWGKAAIGLPKMTLGNLKKIIKDAVSGLFTRDASGALKFIGKVGKGVQRWTPQVLQALSELHQPASYLGITLRRMNQESGGNPLAVNLWDSNAKAGYPSTGLMQVIRPTFQHYAGKYRKKGPFMYGVSVDPLANIYSSMRYALAAYGSLPRAYNRAGGYDSGGYLQPGLNLAYNGTGRPEPVFTTQQANALMRLAVEPGGASLDGQQLQLVLDDGTKFTAHLEAVADGRIAVGNQQLISTLRANRRG
ncbi:transglycosylase SLT domain-containing protein [Streptomyces hygroscopicus]|uniref:transglycosylase SLT domain-containing protein n=1 Tax=Streptomyces hygroscopicus TaxID=1912 RepID=UPI00381F1C6D